MATREQLVCPSCRNVLSDTGSFPSIGPPVIQCSKCETLINTTMKEWATMSASERIVASLKELFMPSTKESFIGGAWGCANLIAIGVLILAIVNGIWIAILGRESLPEWVELGMFWPFAICFLVPSILLATPILLIWINHSNRYTRDKTAPRW